jgi:ABC-type uncharacterized transport system auxiliary subunit
MESQQQAGLNCTAASRNRCGVSTKHRLRHPQRCRAGHWLSLLLGMVCLALAGGCLSRPNLPSASYALNCPPAAVAPVVDGPVLGIKSVVLSPLFEGKNFVYRLDENRYEKDPYAEFLVTPERMVNAAAQAHLRNTGLFREVLDGGGVLKPAQYLEIQVRELYGDFRNPQAPSAVIALKVVVYESGRDNRVLLEKSYRRQTPLTASTAAAVAAGLSDGLKEIMTELGRDLKGASPK